MTRLDVKAFERLLPYGANRYPFARVAKEQMKLDWNRFTADYILSNTNVLKVKYRQTGYNCNPPGNYHQDIESRESS